LTVLSNPAFWAVVGATLAVLGGAIGLTTALINRKAATAGRSDPAALPAKEPGILLPTRLHHFVDRAEAIEQAVTHIAAGERVVAIEGGTGVGKSAVATELAHRLRLEGADRIPDLHAHDYLWIDGHNRPVSLVEICRQVTLATGDQSVSSVADDEKLPALRAHLARNNTVLLLDNIKIGQDSDPLHDLLRTVPSGSLVIAAVNTPYTLDASRVVLQELESTYVLELVRYEALRLALGDLRLFDQVFATRLQAAVGGNPRLIESFLRALSRSPESVEDLFDTVEGGEGPRELFMPVWRELPPGPRSVLAACAYLRGQSIAEQLAVACEMDREDVSRALAELMRVGLMTVVRSADRPELYVCPYSARRFVLGEVSSDAIASFTKQLTAYYIHQFASEPENADWAVPHVAGIKAVLQWLFDREDDADLQALFASILDVLMTLGLFDDRVTTGRLSYESAMRAGNHRGASLATDVMASTHAARGELEQAREALALGLVAAEQSGDPGERARQMRANGVCLYKGGEARRALAAILGADGLARQTGELEIVVNVLGLRTVAHWYVGEFEESAAAAEEQLHVCREMGWQRAAAYPLRNLAEVAIHGGEFARAYAYVEDAREVASTFSDRRQIARIRLTTARLELFDRKLDSAARQAFAAETDAIELGLPPELREARAIRIAAGRARLLPPLARRYARRRPPRFTDAPIGGD
jgi:hypothetical protein